MFVSCSTIGGVRSQSADDEFLKDQLATLERVSSVGYDTIELFFNRRPKWVREQIVESVRRHNLRTYSIHLPKLMLTYDNQKLQDDLKSIGQIVQDLGIEVAVLHPPFVRQLRDPVWGGRFEAILQEMESSDCLLTFEIVPYIRNPHLFIREQMVYEYPDHQFGVTVDLEYMHLTGLKIEYLIDEFGDKIANIHFRDSDGEFLTEDGKRKYLNPGDGELDLQDIVRRLSLAGYDKALTIEVSHADENNIRKSKEYVEQLLRNVES